MNDKGMSPSPISRHSFSRSKALIIRAERERERGKKRARPLPISSSFPRCFLGKQSIFSPLIYPPFRLLLAISQAIEREPSLLVVFPQKSSKTFNCLFKKKCLEKLLITFQNSLAKSIFKPSLQNLKVQSKKRGLRGRLSGCNSK